LGDIVHAHGKPVMAWLYGPSTYVRAWEEALARIGVPVFAELRMVATALAGMDQVARYRVQAASTSTGRIAAATSSDPARKIIAAARAQQAKTLTEPEAYNLLENFGLRAPRWEMVASETEAIDAARRIGFPVVLKIVSRQILHKTDIGGVCAGITDAESMTSALRSMRATISTAAPEASIEGFLVQRMVNARIEVIAGMTHSREFGPAIMLGLGGIFVEAIGHVEFALPPFDAHEVDEMIERTGLGKLLGARGGAHDANRSAVRNAVLALRDLAGSNLGIEQIEVNPLVVLPDGGGVAAIDALIVLD